MNGFKPLQVGEPATQQLCEERRETELLKTRGTLREYRTGKRDAEILRNFKTQYEPDIMEEACLANTSITGPRYYGPRELETGTIASPEHTITIFIPLAPRLSSAANPQKPPKVLFQPNRDKETVREPITWHIGTPIQIPGNSRLVVDEGLICFEMLQYDWKPAKHQDRESEGEGVRQNSADQPGE
ncbi:hypothetical protein CT0861_05067 [Colletotrichum tofieldiae]|uniref:Uncharacterized protein n=1 Tax=Colletotrichum tofieldiae TaxID=708197 RepID=A0A166MD88_9PEZI|nr:hypothetical protein CT0861_05067 [Colletotrichum tofieldiae]